MGATGFGGPIALLGLMEKEWVQKRKRITHEQFQQDLALAKLFPGPLSTMFGIRLAADQGGIGAGLLAGCALIFPSFLMVIFGSHFLDWLQTHPENQMAIRIILLGMTWTALVLSGVAVWRLAKPQFLVLKNIPAILIVATLIFLYPKFEPYLVISAGLIYLLRRYWHKIFGGIHDAAAPIALIFWASFQASCVTFGSGIAIVPSLQAQFVENYHWISQQQFLDGLFLGQITPGPLLIVSTFLGYKASGLSGAIASTVGAFLPAFLIGLLVIPFARKSFSRYQAPRIFLNGVLIGVAGALLGSTLKILSYALDQSPFPTFPWICGLGMLSAFALKKSPNPLVLVIVGCGLAGLIQLLLLI